MFCNQCGQSLKETDRYCSRCGAKVEQDAFCGDYVESTNSSKQKTVSCNYNSNPNTKKNLIKIITIIIIIVIVAQLILVLIGVIITSRNGSGISFYFDHFDDTKITDDFLDEDDFIEYNVNGEDELPKSLYRDHNIILEVNDLSILKMMILK